MKKKSLVLLITIWGVLLASLIYLGIYNSGSSEVRFAKEDTIVSVTGASVQSEPYEDGIDKTIPGERDADLREGQAGSEGDASESPAIDRDKPEDDKSSEDIFSGDAPSGDDGLERRGSSGGGSGEGASGGGGSHPPSADQNVDGVSGDDASGGGGSGDRQKAEPTSTPAVEKEKKHT